MSYEQSLVVFYPRDEVSALDLIDVGGWLDKVAFVQVVFGDNYSTCLVVSYIHTHPLLALLKTSDLREW